MFDLVTPRTALGIALFLVAVLGVAAALTLPADRDEPTVRAPRPTVVVSSAFPSVSTDSATDDKSRRQPGTTLSVARQIASSFHLSITSGYRDPEHNARVGGAEGSYHARGTARNPGAVDLVGATADMRQALEWAQKHVRDLAEGLIHAVCLVDDEHPLRVSDGGLHLHLAFDSRDAAATSTPYISVALHSGCRAASDRFRVVLRTIRRQRASGDLSAREAARVSLTAATAALDGAYGPLGPRGRAVVVTAQRRSRDLLDRAIAARRSAETKPTAYERYRSIVVRADEREHRDAISADEARSQRQDAALRALRGDYGELTAAQREAVRADRANWTAPEREPSVQPPPPQAEQQAPAADTGLPPATAPVPNTESTSPPPALSP